MKVPPHEMRQFLVDFQPTKISKLWSFTFKRLSVASQLMTCILWSAMLVSHSKPSRPTNKAILHKSSTQTKWTEHYKVSYGLLLLLQQGHRHTATFGSHPTFLTIFRGLVRRSRLTGFLTAVMLQWLCRLLIRNVLQTFFPGCQHLLARFFAHASWSPEDLRFKDLEATVGQGSLL